MMEAAYTTAAAQGLAVWTADQARSLSDAALSGEQLASPGASRAPVA